MSSATEEKVLAALERLEAKVDKLDQRMDAMEKRMDSLEKRVESIEKTVKGHDKKLSDIELRVKELESQANKLKDALEPIREDILDIHNRQKADSEVIAALYQGTQIANAENDGLRQELAKITGEHVVFQRKIDLLQQMAADVMSDISRMKAAQ
ncbi:MAG: hypothetical protein LBS19_08675 [Clostridiales bacterium]|jgi:chromosome segregation ATPase|nr:hypothetical protein [Clostridiales bacterium]